jgi:alkylation response protein AidB-like acyl-CoA dehydrogenase
MIDSPVAQRLFRPPVLRPGDADFVPLAAELGSEFASRAAEHDRDNTFVRENFDRMREAGYLRLAVPVELGGLGATMRQVCVAQAELGRYCGSTALSVNMHLFQTLATVYRWRRGAAVEPLLRRIARDGIVVMSSGGSDGMWPSGTAVREDGGYRISGRKVFCSQAPVADVLATMAVYDDPQDGPVVLAIGIPTATEGFEIVETWDTLGMRGTSSHDVQLDNVFVADAQVAARRPWGRVDPVLRNAGVHFAPPVASVYWGIAAGARDEAVRIVCSRRTGDGQALSGDAIVQRQVGLMDTKLRTAWWSLAGALDEIGEEYELDDWTMGTLMMAKREIVTKAIEVVDLAMDLAGGSSYFKRSPLERAYRDVRAASFHPLNPEKTLLHAGRLALGQPADTIW